MIQRFQLFTLVNRNRAKLERQRQWACCLPLQGPWTARPPVLRAEEARRSFQTTTTIMVITATTDKSTANPLAIHTGSFSPASCLMCQTWFCLPVYSFWWWWWPATLYWGIPMATWLKWPVSSPLCLSTSVLPCLRASLCEMISLGSNWYVQRQ